MHKKIIQALTKAELCNTRNVDAYVLGKPTGGFAGSKKKRKIHKKGK